MTEFQPEQGQPLLTDSAPDPPLLDAAELHGTLERRCEPPPPACHRERENRLVVVGDCLHVEVSVDEDALGEGAGCLDRVGAADRIGQSGVERGIALDQDFHVVIVDDCLADRGRLAKHSDEECKLRAGAETLQTLYRESRRRPSVRRYPARTAAARASSAAAPPNTVATSIANVAASFSVFAAIAVRSSTAGRTGARPLVGEGHVRPLLRRLRRRRRRARRTPGTSACTTCANPGTRCEREGWVDYDGKGVAPNGLATGAVLGVVRLSGQGVGATSLPTGPPRPAQRHRRSSVASRGATPREPARFSRCPRR